MQGFALNMHISNFLLIEFCFPTGKEHTVKTKNGKYSFKLLGQ